MAASDKQSILILGASGQFGSVLCRRLIREFNFNLLLGGRNARRLRTLQSELKQLNPTQKTDILILDFAKGGLEEALLRFKPRLVVHLAGPFQNQDYAVARACIVAGISYVDMADGRDYVEGFSELDFAAREKKIFLITGASTVPSLSSAIIDQAIINFMELEDIEYGISLGLKTGLGVATLRAVLIEAGRSYNVLKGGKVKKNYGFQNATIHYFPPPVGPRVMLDCNIPDHAIFSKRYPKLKTLSFAAGMDHIKLERILMPLARWAHENNWVNLSFLAKFLKPLLFCLKPFGREDSGFYMRLVGKDANGKTKKNLIEIMALGGCGLQIPITPVLLLLQKITENNFPPLGAYPCVGLFSTDEFKKAYSPFSITWSEREPHD